jgi:2-keto-4-pentenoate hydratase/2-oxohepta-3-ene-1,7-dioic acid hydratase in catechol pathway
VSSQRSFALGTFSAAGSPAFAGLVIDARVIALHALRERLIGSSMFELLEHWEQNLAALAAVVAAFDTPAGAALRACAVPLTQLRVEAPLQPRQILCAGANYRKHVIDLIVDQPVTVDVHIPKEDRRRHAEALMDHRAAHGKPFIFETHLVRSRAAGSGGAAV